MRSVVVSMPALFDEVETSAATAAAAATDAGSVLSSCSTSTPGRSTNAGVRAVV